MYLSFRTLLGTFCHELIVMTGGFVSHSYSEQRSNRHSLLCSIRANSRSCTRKKDSCHMRSMIMCAPEPASGNFAGLNFSSPAPIVGFLAQGRGQAASRPKQEPDREHETLLGPEEQDATSGLCMADLRKVGFARSLGPFISGSQI